MSKPETRPTPDLPTRPDKPGEVVTPAPRIDEAELHRKNTIAKSRFGVGDKMIDTRTKKECEIVGIGVRSGVPVYLVQFGEDRVLRNQDEFDAAQTK